MKEELIGYISAKLSNFLNKNPSLIKVNSSISSFEKIEELKIDYVSDYQDKELLSGNIIKVNVRGEIAFNRRPDINLDFTLLFSCNQIEFIYNLEEEKFEISEPKNIVFTKA